MRSLTWFVTSRVVPKKFAQSKVFCGRALDGPLLAPVYAGSGWTAFREQVLREPVGKWTHRIDPNARWSAALRLRPGAAVT